MTSKEPDKSEQLSNEELDKVSGGQPISVPVTLHNKITVKIPDGRSIAQQDSPYETNDNLPT
jgi:bacteriocin-like protein